jgi:hypothetical protein
MEDQAVHGIDAHTLHGRFRLKTFDKQPSFKKS